MPRARSENLLIFKIKADARLEAAKRKMIDADKRQRQERPWLYTVFVSYSQHAAGPHRKTKKSLAREEEL